MITLGAVALLSLAASSYAYSPPQRMINEKLNCFADGKDIGKHIYGVSPAIGTRHHEYQLLRNSEFRDLTEVFSKFIYSNVELRFPLNREEAKQCLEVGNKFRDQYIHEYEKVGCNSENLIYNASAEYPHVSIENVKYSITNVSKSKNISLSSVHKKSLMGRIYLTHGMFYCKSDKQCIPSSTPYIHELVHLESLPCSYKFPYVIEGDSTLFIGELLSVVEEQIHLKNVLKECLNKTEFPLSDLADFALEGIEKYGTLGKAFTSPAFKAFLLDHPLMIDIKEAKSAIDFWKRYYFAMRLASSQDWRIKILCYDIALLWIHQGEQSTVNSLLSLAINKQTAPRFSLMLHELSNPKFETSQFKLLLKLIPYLEHKTLNDFIDKFLDNPSKSPLLIQKMVSSKYKTHNEKALGAILKLIEMNQVNIANEALIKCMKSPIEQTRLQALDYCMILGNKADFTVIFYGLVDRDLDVQSKALDHLEALLLGSNSIEFINKFKEFVEGKARYSIQLGRIEKIMLRSHIYFLCDKYPNHPTFESLKEDTENSLNEKTTYYQCFVSYAYAILALCVIQQIKNSKL